MEVLSAIFVSVVTAVSSLLPNANLPTVLGDETETVRVETVERKNELLEAARLKREEVRSRVEERRQEVAQNIEEKREEFRKRLAEIKDERKQKIVENVAERLISLNSKWVTHWNNVLTRLTEILAKIENKSNTLAESGIDTTALVAGITDAKNAISNAQGAVDSQATKSYVIDITDEQRLGTDVEVAMDQFHSDVRLTWDLVKDARESVRLALTEMAKLIGEEIQAEAEVES